MTLSISVICPAWQAAATLPETLASVHRQTLPPTEILVVDDGSTDTTATLANASGATVIKTAHAGVSAALNRGVASSFGEIVAFVDADDLWPNDKLEFQTNFLTLRPDLAGVLGLMNCFVSPDVTRDESARYTLPSELPNGWVTGALLIRRVALDAVGPFDETLIAGHAIDWFDRARRLGLIFAMPQRVVLHRRIRPGSLSHRSRHRDLGYVLMARKAIERRRAENKRND